MERTIDVESVVTYPNNKKADFLNYNLLFTFMIHTMPENRNFQSCITYLSDKMIHRYT